MTQTNQLCWNITQKFVYSLIDMAIKWLARWAQFEIAFKMFQSIEDALSDRDNLMLCDNVLNDGLQLMDFSILDLVNTAAHFTQLLI